MKPRSLVTGSATGIGYNTVLRMLRAGHQVIMVARDRPASHEARQRLVAEAKVADELVDLVCADLGSRASIQAATQKIVDTYDRLDVLVNNAGVWCKNRTVDSDGLEQNFAVNYLAVVQMSSGLLPLLEESPQGRIVNVNSDLWKSAKLDLSDLQLHTGYSAKRAYCNSKLLNLLYTRRLASHLHSTHVTVNAVHPGVAGSNMFKDQPVIITTLQKRLLPSPYKISAAPFWVATSKSLATSTGDYFYKEKLKQLDVTRFPQLGAATSDAVWEQTVPLLSGYACVPAE